MSGPLGGMYPVPSGVYRDLGGRGPDRQEGRDGHSVAESDQVVVARGTGRPHPARGRGPRGSTPAMMWCTTERLPGWKSTARIQRSSGKLVLRTKTRKSSVPVGAMLYGSGIVSVRSGSPSAQSDENVRGAGASFRSPSGHCSAERKPRASRFQRRSTLAHRRNRPPKLPEASQGIVRSLVTCARSAARLRAWS